MRQSLVRRLERIEQRLSSEQSRPARLAIVEQIELARQQALASGDRIVVDWTENFERDWWGRERILSANSEARVASLPCPGPPSSHRIIAVQGPQAAVISSSERFRVLVAGRRFGKTQVALIELLRAVRRPDQVAWYVAPTYRQAKHIAWKRLKELVRPYRSLRIYETDLRIEFPWQATMALRGADNYDSLRGEGLDFVVLDEYASMAPEAWTEVLRPMLSDRNGRALFIGTPKGFNHFKDLYIQAQTKPGWSAHLFTTLQGSRVPQAEIDAAKADLDEKTFRQEYEASFENFEGRVYYAFDRARNLSAEVGYNPLYPICWSLDFNVNPMCSVVAQVIDTTNRLEMLQGMRSGVINVLDELFLPNSSTPQACEEFYNRTQAFRRGRQLNVIVYGDATGSARQTASAGAESDWQTIRNFFARHAGEFQVTYKYKRENPRVRDRVAAVNGMLQNALGQSKLFIDPRCKHLVKDLEQVTWKPGVSLLDQDADKQLTHISDALGYLCEAEFGVRPAGGYDPRFLA